MTQMARAQQVKKHTENQSMAALTLRRRVGSAKAANTARGGSPSSSARSEPPIAALMANAAPSKPSGNAIWRRIHWRRQVQSVHAAMGQVGQQNQASSLSRPRLCGGVPSFQTQACSAVATAAAARPPASSHVRSTARLRSAESPTISMATAHSTTAVVAAPLAPIITSAITSMARARPGR